MRRCFRLSACTELERLLCTVHINVNLFVMKALYINKIKIKINSGAELTFQLLLSSEYNINIVAQDLMESFQTFHEILFAILLVLQSCLTISGL